MTLSQLWQPELLSWSNYNTFLSQLLSARLVDIARIQTVSDDGKYAMVNLVDGSNTFYKAEIIAVGSNAGIAFPPTSGQYCLLFFTATPFDITTSKLDIAGQKYSDCHTKCFPIGSPGEEGALLRSTEAGISISTKNYNVLCSEQGIGITSKNTNVAIDDEHVNITVADSLNSCTLDSEGYHIKAGIQYDDQGEAKPKATIDVQSDGSIVLNTIKDDTVQASIKLSIDGAVNITTQDAYTIEGKNGVSIDGKNGKVSIKNASYDLLTAFEDLITVLDTFKTQGSPAAHTAVPNQFMTVKQKIEGLLE